ncbi:hypothetical protein KY330_04165 [Candidatus Woesearchaeota archaeon]|nr:hypothetical protein [Candidatus Woesearchaeota archaeon]
MKRLYDKYPLWIVIIVNILLLAVYLAGGFIMFKLNWITGVIFIVYVGLIEIFMYKEACPNCFYYGKRCAFGKGVIAGLIFKKGNPQKFCEKEISFKDFIPQTLTVLVPLIVGIALLISRGFDTWVVIAVAYPVISWFAVNPIVYGKLACPHCKQGSVCCPALKFFKK